MPLLLLQLDNVTLSISTQVLLEHANAIVVEGDKVGLVGANGAGKSTLLKAIGSNDDENYWTLTSGSIQADSDVLVVEQDALAWQTLWPDVENAENLTVGEAMDEALVVEDAESWRALLVEMERHLGWDVAKYDETPIGALSPGCAKRAYLAITLMRADVRILLLDEPTNHLDLPSILWLQHAIVASPKTFVIISHDEVFLDAVTTHVWEIDVDTHMLHVTGAKFSAFKHAKEVAKQRQMEAYEAQQKRSQRLTAAAEKLRAASKAGERVVSRDHDLLQRDFRRNRAGRSGKKAKAIEKLRDAEDAVERVVERVPLHIGLDNVAGAGTDASFVLNEVKLGYGECELPLPAISTRIDFGERVALLGPNGVGKSTLLRTLLGQLPPRAGTVDVGRELVIGNLTQEHESLPSDAAPREHMASVTQLGVFDCGRRLMRYGLTRWQVEKPIGALNSGARARLLLGIFAHRHVNALVLDEPTNHLDEDAVREVIATVNRYEGTVIVVSHDRAFLRALSLSRTFSLSCEHGLREIDSLEVFVEEAEENARRVIESLSGRG